MKKYLLVFSLFSSLAFINRLSAQCTVSQPTITLNSQSDVSGTCQVNFDLTFDLPSSNGGNKMQVIHIWRNSNYNTLLVQGIYGSNDNSAPSVTDLNTSNTLVTLVIDRDLTTTQCYSRNGSGTCSGAQPTSLQTGKTVIKSTNGSTVTYTIKSVQANVSGACSGAITLVADVWSTQSSSLNSVSCLSRNKSFYVNDPLVTGFKTCSTPRTYNLGITSSAPMTVYYELYKDNGNGQFDPADQLVYTSGNLTTPVSLSNQSYPGNNVGGESAGLWVRVYNTADLTYSITKLFANACAPLPVTFKSFSASRNNQMVSLKWETASEQNNKGFYVQRNVSGEWKDVAFVFSAADGGNSDRELSYAYNDPNNYKAISYYRLLQVDMNGNGKYSEIRTVKGTESSAKLTLFPNPGTNGRINVMFDEVSAKDVWIYDANGRVVKSYKNLVSNSLMIDQLKPGVYNVQVKNNDTQIVSSEKFIIQN